MQAQTRTRYSPMIIFLHWLIALMVIIMLCIGFFLDDVPDALKPTVYMMHKSVGLTVLILMLTRIVWVHATGKPPLPDSMAFWEIALARFVQFGFYILLILMPLSGWIMSVAAGRVPSYFGFFEAPIPGVHPDQSLADFMANSHKIIAWVLVVFIILHTLGALKHHFIDKNRVMRTMWFGKD